MTGTQQTYRSRYAEELCRADFNRIAEVMRREAGIELAASKLPLVQSRLRRRLKALCLTDYASYCDLVETAGADDERLELLSVLTTNVTGFFREAHHFDYIARLRIPDLAARLKAGDAVRLWSAGCSTGEEACSLALTFLDAIPDIARYDFRILATDIAPAVIATAVAGVYARTDLSSVPEHLRAAYFQPDDTPAGEMRIAKAVRDLITYRRLNLINPWPLSRRFDVILCRNVVIYFGDETKAAIWTRMARQLRPDGLLMTGHSERLTGSAAEEMALVSTTTYRPRR